jgi:hypothetical protein
MQKFDIGRRLRVECHRPIEELAADSSEDRVRVPVCRGKNIHFAQIMRSEWFNIPQLRFLCSNRALPSGSFRI